MLEVMLQAKYRGKTSWLLKQSSSLIFVCKYFFNRKKHQLQFNKTILNTFKIMHINDKEENSKPQLV